VFKDIKEDIILGHGKNAVRQPLKFNLKINNFSQILIQYRNDKVFKKKSEYLAL
jgi:hypothetical protein